MMKDPKVDPGINIIDAHFNKEREYWLHKLSGELVKSKFIYDSRIKTGHRLFEELKFRLNPGLYSRLTRLAKESDLRLFMILLAGLTLLLYKYTSGTDIIVGTTIAKQKIARLFINTILPIRNQVHDNITFKELLLRVKDTTREAIENQNYPIETILTDLELDDWGDDFPLFEIAILLENIQDKKYFNEIKPNVLFSFFRTGENIEGCAGYNATLYRKTSIERIVNHFNHLLENALRFYNSKISGIELLPGEEMHRILYDFNSSQAGTPGNITLIELIEKQAEMTPQNIALRFEGDETTYQELNQQANQLARVIRKCGIKNDQPVCILLERTPRMLECIMAVWKAGGAYIPIDPQYPPKRVTDILNDSKTKVLLTRSEYLNHEIEENYEGHVIALELQLNDIRTEDTGNLNLDIRMNDLAYIIYTSGSTGKPKGVMVEHIGMMNHMQAKIKDFEITSASIIAQNASHTFDISVWQFFAALMVGGQTVIYLKELLLDAQQFISKVIENNITILEVVPSYLSIMLDCLDTSFKEFKTLKYLLVTGEELKPILAKRWLQKYPGIKMANAYGPTEASDDITHYIFSRIPDYERIPIGKPLQNFNIYITDENMNLCPIGVEGEITVSGIGVGRGYLNDDMKTKQVFINDPFSEGKKIRLFKTGDLGRWLTDGNIEFFGRKDYQVKIRGYRIELGEIENILLNHSGVKEAVVIDRDDKKGDKYLCAYLVTNKPLEDSEIKEYLSGTLPDYMKPSYFVRLDQIPLTGSGKIDRKALPEPVSESDSKVIYLTAEALKVMITTAPAGPIIKDFIEDTFSEKYELTEEEREQVLYTFNQSKKTFPKNKSLTALFEEQVGKKPDRISIVLKDGGITYNELNRKANQLARALKLKGIKTNTIVGFMLDNSFEMIIAILGILKAGGAYLPIDSWYPEARRNYIINQVNTKFLIAQRQHIDQFENHCEIFDIDYPGLFKGNGKNLGMHSDPNDLFYITFTSGTTGRPKGSAVQHSSFLNHMMWFINEFEFNVNDNVILLTSIAFDLTQKSVFAPILTGGKLYFPSLYYMDAGGILQDIWNNNISLVNCTPSIFYKLLEFSDEEDMQKLASLRYVLLGGESLSIKPLMKWIESGYFNAEIANTYGVTECAGISAYYRIKNPIDFDKKKVPIGKPISNCKLYILDRNHSPVPIEKTGELYIAGDGVGVGYLNDISLSHEQFIQLSLGKELNQLVYRTGDYAKWLPDGNIEFLGRIDNQVNIEGIRIELGDIESCLLELKDIKEAAVIEKENRNGDIILCACFVSERNFSLSELRKHLSKELPLFMMPSYFVRLEKMPLTPNGKVARKVLRAIDIKMGMDSGYVGPGDEIEEKLVEIWAEVLGVEKANIGIDREFFELGGHSLSAMMLLSNIQQAFNVKILLRQIFEKPTIQELSQLIKSASKERHISIDKVEEKEYYALSSAQRRLYLLQQMDMNLTAYNMPVFLEVEGNLEKTKLTGTFKKLIARHEGLRTSFKLIKNEVVQGILQEAAIELEYYEPGDQPVDEIVTNFVKPFDLAKPPLLRAGLIKLAENRHIFLFDMHHIVTDGVSMEIFVRDFTALYEGKELPELKLRYRDFSQWQDGEKEKQVITRQEAYWVKEFEGEIPVLHLPYDYVRPAVQSFEGSSIRFEIGREETKGLNQLALEQGATLFMVLLALYNILLSKLSSQEDIVVGAPTAGRWHVDLEQIIGIFLNILPLRNFPKGEKTFLEFLGEIKERTLNAFDNQDWQFEDLVDTVVVNRDISRNPLFDVMFIMQNLDEAEVKTTGLKLKPYKYQNVTAKFDLNLEASESDEKIYFILGYCTRLFKRERIELFIQYFKNIASSVLNEPHQKLSELTMFQEEERYELLSQLSDDLKRE